MSQAAGYLITALWVYMIVIVVGSLLSWFPAPYGGTVFEVKRLVDRVTEPYLGIFRRALHSINVGSIGLDLSPALGIIVLYIAQIALLRI